MGKLTGNRSFYETNSYGLSARRFLVVVISCMTLLSCTGLSLRGDQPRGVYHCVKKGETLSMIARAYRVDLQDLAEVNNIENPNRIEADSVILIPDANQIMDDVMTAARLRVSSSTPGAGRGSAKTVKIVKTIPQTEPFEREVPIESRKRPEAPRIDEVSKDQEAMPRIEENDKASRESSVGVGTEKAEDQPVVSREITGKSAQVRFDRKRFIWPVNGKVISRFGFQSNRLYYNGIRISAGEGVIVQAAADGVVIFSASLKDYGETVIIQHKDQYATVYTHLGTRVVDSEARVRSGDRIAALGKGDDREAPYLGFEIRHKNKARNPLFFLP
jgi:lipoprotein NlpD